MTGLYIFGALVVISIGVLIYYKAKWAKARKTENRSRADNIERERIEQEDKDSRKARG